MDPRWLIPQLAALYKHIRAAITMREHRISGNADATDDQDRMATRQERIDAFTHEGVPPADQPLELLCEDHVGTYVIPFLCRWRSGVWQSVDSRCPIEATVVGWRVR